MRDKGVPDEGLERLGQGRHEPRIRHSHDDDFVAGPFGVPAIAAHNPQHAAPRTVMPETQTALAAFAATGIDVRHHTATNPRTIVSVDHLAHELMPEHAAISHVATGQLEVRIANASEPHLNQRFADQTRGLWMITDQPRGLCT